MGEKDLYDYWSDTYKVHTLDWNRETAAAILKEFQEKFNKEVNEVVADIDGGKKYAINSFSSSHLNSLLENCSEFSLVKVAIGYSFMVRAVSHMVLKTLVVI